MVRAALALLDNLKRRRAVSMIGVVLLYGYQHWSAFVLN
jgi:hypothetical protein